MKKVYIHRENIVETNVFWDHIIKKFDTDKCGEECRNFEEEYNKINNINTENVKK